MLISCSNPPQDFHDTTLELERMKVLNVRALLIQKVLRGFKYRYGEKNRSITSRLNLNRQPEVCSFHVVCRKEFLKKKSAAVVIQKCWRGHKGRKLYQVVSPVMLQLVVFIIVCYHPIK